MKLYRYVGPKRLADRVGSAPPTGTPIRSPEDVRTWFLDTQQELVAGCVVATFVVNESGQLLISDRRSEHVACAGGKLVQAAGEITFAITQLVEVLGVSNQSTGYCPGPLSWAAVSAALHAAGIVAPEGFAMACEFRRCCGCQGLTLVKHDLFECAECGAALPTVYNVQ